MSKVADSEDGVEMGVTVLSSIGTGEQQRRRCSGKRRFEGKWM